MIVMSIAGVDPSGGAGIFSDIKTFQALGVYGTGVVSCLTSQNPYEFFSSKVIEPDYVASQIDSVISAYDEIEFIKTGMLYNEEIIKIVVNKIEEYGLKAVVDPVMVSTSGGSLSENNIANVYNEYLLPNAFFTTPNVYEAEILTNMKITNRFDATEAVMILSKKCNNMITGGDLEGKNIYYIDGEVSLEKKNLIKSENVHGTGCNLSAAIVSFLAKGNTLEKSIKRSINYVYESVKNGNYGTLIAKINR